MAFEIEFKMTLAKEDILDILCSCFEGGCNYWAILDNTGEEWEAARKRCGEEYPTIEDTIFKLLEEGNKIHLIDAEDDSDYYFDKKDFAKGIRMAIENHFWDGDDVCDVDGEVGDVIIQYAVFNEVVYG